MRYYRDRYGYMPSVGREQKSASNCSCSFSCFLGLWSGSRKRDRDFSHIAYSDFSHIALSGWISLLARGIISENLSLLRGAYIMAQNTTANIGFEKQIWDAACVLRGNMDASEYKNIVLGLIFLKYISDRFEDKYRELVEEGDGFEEDIDEYTSEGIFFVPPEARWSQIAKAAHTPEIGTVIDNAMRSIEKENKRLKDILLKNFARPELDKRRLGDVVDLFTNVQMIEHGSEKDILGRTYEYCLSMFAEQEGKRGGEFFTPSCVVRTLVEVLQPFNGRVYENCTMSLIRIAAA